MPNRGVDFLEQLHQLTQGQGWGMINISSGVGKLQLTIEPCLGTLKNLRSLTENYRGFLTILESPVQIKKEIEPWGYSPNVLPIMEKTKQQFDPQNILSPGRFFSYKM